MNFFKPVALAAAALMATSPVFAAQHHGGGGGGGGSHSASRSMGKSQSAVRHAPFHKSQKPSNIGQRPMQHKPIQHSQHKQTQQHKQASNYPKQHQQVKHYPTQMKPSHIQTKWQIKSNMTKYHWSSNHYKFYKDSWGHYYNASSRCWFDGYQVLLRRPAVPLHLGRLVLRRIQVVPDFVRLEVRCT